jgi:hypothetical protein
MGKMDTTDLSERFFDENTILYSVSARNEIVFSEASDKKEENREEKKEEKTEETITFIPGEGVEAVIHGQNDESKDSPIDGEIVLDSDEMALIAQWKAFKSTNPDGALTDFYATLTNTNQEG